MGRRPAVTVKPSSSFKPAPARLAQWHALTPKYARLYEAMTQGGGVRDLSRAARTSTDARQLRKMLEGARLLSFVDEPMSGYFEVRTLPPIDSLTNEKVEALAEIGAPLFHGNDAYIEYAWPLYVHWCTAYQTHYKRAYAPVTVDQTTGEVVDEVRAIRRLALLVQYNERIEFVMDLFIERHPALELEHYSPFRTYGLTLLTLCTLYADLLQKLEWTGVISLDEDERSLILAKRAHRIRRRRVT